MSGGRSPRRKGSAFEREVVTLLREHGLAAERVPLSGAVKTSRFDHDISVPVRGIDRRIEAKRRRRAFVTIDRMLADNFALVVRDDRSRPLVILTLASFAELAIDNPELRRQSPARGEARPPVSPCRTEKDCSVMKTEDVFPSRFVKAADIGDAEPVVTISKVAIENVGDDKKPVVYFVGKQKGLVCNRTNWDRISLAAGTDETAEWPGVKIQLYTEPVTYAGKTAPAIRVKAVKKAMQFADSTSPTSDGDFEDFLT
jgi:Holliday junction resolvase